MLSSCLRLAGASARASGRGPGRERGDQQQRPGRSQGERRESRPHVFAGIGRQVSVANRARSSRHAHRRRRSVRGPAPERRRNLSVPFVLRPDAHGEGTMVHDQASENPAGGHSAEGSRTFGDLVRTYRHRSGLSQEELADRAGVTARGLRKIEMNQIDRPRPSTVRLLADALGLAGAPRDRFCEAGSAHRAAADAARQRAAVVPAPRRAPPGSGPSGGWATDAPGRGTRLPRRG